MQNERHRRKEVVDGLENDAIGTELVQVETLTQRGLLRRRREEAKLLDADLKDLGASHRRLEIEFAEQVVESRVIGRVGSRYCVAVSANEIHRVLDGGERDVVSRWNWLRAPTVAPPATALPTA